MTSFATSVAARISLVFLLISLMAVSASAQDEAPAPPSPAPGAFDHVVFGVGLEGFYQYNWNRPFDRINLLRAYDTRANVFGIQQANVIVESAPDIEAGRRFGARVDLQFGQATETVQGGAANEPRPDVYRHVWQAYGSYVFPVGRGLQTDFGKFASILGYETNYAKDNNNFSRAYLFNFLPFYHSGLRVTLPVTDQVALIYMLTNGIQQTEDFNNFKSNHLAAVIRPIGNLTWTTSYYFGQEQPDRSTATGQAARITPDGFYRVIDSYFAYTPTAKLGLGVDVNYVTNEVSRADAETSLQGIGAYARYQVTSPATLSLRYERLDDEGLFGGIEQTLQEVTATLEYKFAEGFLIRGEFRRDWSNERFFTTARPGDLRDHQTTALVGLVWWFGNKSGTW